MNAEPKQFEPDAPRKPRNPFFHLAAIGAGVFILTILAMLAAAFGNPDAPSARFFATYGGLVVVAEVVGVLFLGGVAMAVDRRQSLRRQASIKGNDVKPPRHDATDTRADHSPDA